jgi:hypothetical protein
MTRVTSDRGKQIVSLVLWEKDPKLVSLISSEIPLECSIAHDEGYPMEKTLPMKGKQHSFHISYWLHFILMKKHLVNGIGQRI